MEGLDSGLRRSHNGIEVKARCDGPRVSMDVRSDGIASVRARSLALLD
jgi:hypothetical protein